MAKEPMQVTTLRLPAVLLKKIRSMAEEKGVTLSAILRPMIAEGVARSDALKAVESHAGMSMAQKFALFLTMDAAFLLRLMQFPEFRKDIEAREEDVEAKC